MKNTAPTRATLLEGALDALNRGTGLRVRVVKRPRGGRGPDDPAEVVLEGEPPIRFTALVRDAAPRKELGALKALGRRLPARPLLVVPYITPQAAQRARELDLAFVDLAGNAYLTGPGAFVFVTGQKQVPRPRKRAARRTATPGGLRVIFNLLTQPQLAGAAYREIAEAAGVALGTVGAVMEDLSRRGHIRLEPRGKRELLDPDRLAEEWTLLYPMRLRPKLGARRFAASDPGWWRAIRIDPEEAVLGGEAAAELLTGHLEANAVTLYVARPPDALILAHRLRPDDQGEVEILDAFWPLGPRRDEAPTPTAPRLLVIADLLATGDARNIETAQLIEGGPP